MTLKLQCQDYGFECDFVLNGAKNIALLEKLRMHFAEEHGIEYTTEAITQMIINCGHEFIQKEWFVFLYFLILFNKFYF